MKTRLLIIFSIITLSSFGFIITVHAFGGPVISIESAFGTSDTVLTGTIIAVNPIPTLDYTQYEILVDKYLKNPKTLDVLSFLGQGKVDENSKYTDVIFNKNDYVYLLLNEKEGNLHATPSSRVLDDPCYDAEEPKPWLNNIGRKSLVTSDFRVDHFTSYPADKELTIRYYAINTKPVPSNIFLELNITRDDRNNFKSVLYETKNFILAPCNGHKYVEWSFTPTEFGKYHLTFTDVGARNIVTNQIFKVYPEEQYVTLPLADLDIFERKSINFDENNTAFVVIPKISTSENCKKIDHCFNPSKLVVGVGTKVVWENHSNGTLTLVSGIRTSDTHGISTPDSVFQSSRIQPGETFAHTFTESGVYDYHSLYQGWSSGTIVVNDKKESEYSIDENLIENMYPPLIQLKIGIPSEFVKCNNGFVSVIKSSNGYPACVKPKSTPKLIERGWMNYANSEKTFLDKTVNEWESLSFEQVSALYEKHDEFLQKTNGKHFYNMLGEFLVKDKMEKLLVNKDIQNINDDFVVFAGMQLDSLPPRISYYAGVNSTDGKTYLLSGGSSSNKAHANNAKEIIIYDTTIQISIEELVTKESLVTILPEDGNNARVEPYSILLDYDEKNTVEFYNTLDIPIIIESNDFENPASTKKWKTSLIYPNQTIAVTFNSTGFYVWDAKYLPNNSEFWEIMGSGDVGLFTTQSNNLEYTEKLEIARNIIHTSEIPVVGLGIGSDRGLTISLAPGITDVLPDAKEYYMERVKQLIPFDIPIVIED